jgi:hypothetical protein
MQECRFLPAQELPVGSDPVVGGPRSCRLRGEVDADGDGEFIRTLCAAVPHLQLVGDVAIGEPPTFKKVSVKNGGETEWYGTIRLLLFVDPVRFGSSPSVESYAIPTGSKGSVHSEGDVYGLEQAPDKGAVGLYLAAANVLFVNCHLCGTNQYNVPEAEFDAVRLRQLQAIQGGLSGRLRNHPSLVLLGDFNYRVEMFCSPEDKGKGGKDFQAVDALIAGGESAHLLQLYKGHDRLRPLLNMRSCESELLQGCVDGLSVALLEGQHLPPTFSFRQGDVHPRQYQTKRTPSWTDRVLWRDLSVHAALFDSVRDVRVSDHEPVYAVLDVQNPLRETLT